MPADLAGEYLDRMRERFRAAAEAVGGATRDDLEVAGLPLRLSWAGEAMRAVLLPPFAHLATNGAEAPQLSISVFDTASTGVEAPAQPWPQPQAAPGTNPVARLRSDRACVLAAAGTGATTAADPVSGEAFFHLPDARAVPSSERAAPLREALQLLLGARERWLTHAGAVGREGRGVLLVGRGGSGKSTLALGCARAGMEIVADDYVLLEAEPPVAHAMQSTAKLTEDSATRLGLGAELLDPAGFEPTLEGPAKALVEIGTLAPDGLRRRLRIGAIVAPVLSGEAEPSLRPLSAAEGLRAVAPSTIVQSGFQGASSLAALAALARRVPSYAIDLGPDPAANAKLVEHLVEELD